MKGLLQCSFVLVRVTEIWFLQYQVDSSLRKQLTFDVWETSAEIPYGWCVTTQIWVMLLIGWIKFIMRHDQSEALPRSGKWWHHQYGISALVSQASFSGETIGSIIQGIPQLYHIFVKKFSVFLICSLDLRRSRNYDIKRTKWDSKAKTESWRTAWSIGSPACRFGGMQVSCSLKSDYLW